VIRVPDVLLPQFLLDICDNNETLFHALLVENIEYLAPIVYTPTVGLACQQFGFRFDRPRGMYISALDRGQMHACLANWPHREVQVIVVTDGSRILGLGDLGAYGMGIPIGKLALYCAAGGIAPHRVLPVCLDVGTDNQELLHDPYYIGLVQNRLRGDAYFELVDEFLDAVRMRFPDVFVQFEDFSSDVAMDILKYYRNDRSESRDPVCVFNDDIQGTGAVTTAGLFSGLINRGESPENLKDQRIMIAGAGVGGWVGVRAYVYLCLCVCVCVCVSQQHARAVSISTTLSSTLGAIARRGSRRGSRPSHPGTSRHQASAVPVAPS
jgi:malate dehydrogenase (oxaloacetate-decarboxylating)(NADP+)